VARHPRQLQEKGVVGAIAWSGCRAWRVAGRLRGQGGAIAVQGVLQLVPGSVGHVPDAREETDGGWGWPGAGGACVLAVLRRGAWGLWRQRRRGRRKEATGGPRVGVKSHDAEHGPYSPRTLRCSMPHWQHGPRAECARCGAAALATRRMG